IHPFAEDVSEGSERSAYVNIHCIDDLDLDAVPVIDFDGRSA
ncbi:MAG: GFA family protein, partial [Mesorhizobium sp.]